MNFDRFLFVGKGSEDDASRGEDLSDNPSIRDGGLSFSADHHNELFFHHFRANPTHVTGVGGVPSASANDLHQRPGLSADIFHPAVVLITGENISGLV